MKHDAWPVRSGRCASSGLEDEPGPDLSATTTADERLAMMWPLARDAWALAGRAIPDYPRDRTPVRVIRPAGRAQDLVDLSLLETAAGKG